MQATERPQVETVDARPVAQVRATIPVSELPAFFDRAFTLITDALQRQGVAPTSAAFARYHGAPGEVADLEVGFGVDAVIEADGEVNPGELPAAEVAHAVHRGGYDALAASWQALADWIGEHGRVPQDTMWEVYTTEPTPDTDPATLLTDLYWPLAPQPAG